MEQVGKKGNEKIALKRELGLFSAVGMIVAVMIGTNIRNTEGFNKLISRDA